MLRIGFIGLGIMGAPMAANLRRAGHDVTVWNRTRQKAQAWAAEHGGTVAATPAAVAAESDLVVTMVVDGPQVERLLLGEDGVAAQARRGLLCVDMSTIAPDDSRRIAAQLDGLGLGFVEAPVTGSEPKARAGTLTIMVGGEEAHVARAMPALEAMGETIVRVGGVGQAQTVKVLCNAVAATNLATLAQALLVGKRAGVDLERMVEVLRASSAGSAMADLKAEPLLRHDFTTLFKLEHMLKDVRLALEAGQAAGAPFPSAAQTRELLGAAVGQGYGEQDFAALVRVLEGLAGVGLTD